MRPRCRRVSCLEGSGSQRRRRPQEEAAGRGERRAWARAPPAPEEPAPAAEGEVRRGGRTALPYAPGIMTRAGVAAAAAAAETAQPAGE